MEDSLIIDLYIQRNEEAIQQTSYKYGKRIKDIISRILSSHETIEECENDTYLETWNRIPPNEPRDYFLAFISAIARHISIDRFRKDNSKGRQAEIYDLSSEIEEIIPSEIDVEKEVEGKLLISAINKYLIGLPKYKRMIFVRRYFYMDSITEISMECRYSNSKVKSILLRLRRDLAEYLSKEYGYGR
ncbi:MAG: RNA polymerase sigma factor [Lachnospiraceae bacterium]|nr:RNA polymerase sigma factor [Lachnospiraceae bacterium]